MDGKRQKEHEVGEIDQSIEAEQLARYEVFHSDAPQI
jgi:hypothetical protein